jgi:2'-5' RNA ligase
LTEPETLRAFLAVPSPPSWVESARDLVARLRGELPDASWTRPGSWHITLHFLGELSRAQVDRFTAEIAPIVDRAAGGDLDTSGALVFPPRRPARVLAVGFVESAAAASLARIAAEVARLSPQMEDPKSTIHNRFHPHVTFARLRRPWPREAVVRFEEELTRWRPPTWRVESCILFKSRLNPGGAVHTPMQSFRLAAAHEEAFS